MKLGSPICPQCGCKASALLEQVMVLAQLQEPDDSGETEYAGESDVEWDTQYPARDEDGIVTLMCENKHQWFSTQEP